MQPHDPYAAPQLAASMPMGPTPAGTPQPWSLGEALSVGWEALKGGWVVLFFTLILAAVPGFLIGRLQNVVLHALDLDASQPGIWDPNDPHPAGLDVMLDPLFWLVTFGFTILTALVADLFRGGLAKIWLCAARRQELRFGDLFAGFRYFLPLAGLTLLTQALFVVSLPFFMVPSIVVGLGLSMTPFYVVDAEMGLIDAMKASWAATRGHKASLLGYFVVGTLVTMLGLVACCIGMYATMSIMLVGWAWIFTRLSGRSGQPNVFGFGDFPPGGYGPPPGHVPPGYGPQP